MSEKLRIIKMTEDELDAVDVMELEVYGDTAAPFEFLMDAFNDPNGYLYVAYWGDEIAGHCAMSHKTSATPNYCNIGNLMVKKNFRRRGIGKLLMIKILDKAKELGLSRATLKVATENFAAIDLYKSFGFQVEELIKNFYADEGGDAYIMWSYSI
ncbi:MAG: GNAT family N-acetyltransferase [Defluviitaleaceae bacterium]|nr:GNAT family N-acetyltransferase [Defluviitaleaceae bacterium]